MNNFKNYDDNFYQDATENTVGALLFIISAIIIIIVGVYLLSAQLKMKYGGDFAFTSATITNMAKVQNEQNEKIYDYVIYIKYTVDDIDYCNSYTHYTDYNTKHIDDTIRIMYLKSNPNIMHFPPSPLPYIIVLTTGLSALGVGVYMFIKRKTLPIQKNTFK